MQELRHDSDIYRLVYHEVTGHVLSFKYMFHYGGIVFNNMQLDLDSWVRYKTTRPLDAVLHINGKTYDDSKFIGRFLAMKCKLYGSNEHEALDIEVAINSFEVIKNAFKFSWWAASEGTYPILPEDLNKFEEQVRGNKGYFVCGKLSWADILYAAYTKVLYETPVKDINKNHPELKKLVNKVQDLPGIKAFLEQLNLSLI